MLSKPSNDRNSACLNLSELQQGHSCLIQSRRGTQRGHVRLEKFISTTSYARDPEGLLYRPFPAHRLLHASGARHEGLRVREGKQTTDSSMHI